MAKVLCVGSAVIDFVFHLETLPRQPRKYGTEEAAVVGGGCAANAAVAVARLGGRAVLGARVGDDRIGDMILADLEAEGVDTTRVTRNAGGRSSFSSVYIDARGERQIVNFRGTGLVLDTSWFGDLDGLDAVLTDTRRVEAAIDALKLARARGVPGIVDGEEPIDPEILAQASHVAFSLQGLRSLLPDTGLEEALAALAREHDIWAAVTDGEKGVWYTTPRGVAHVPAYPVRAVDTLGAGDIWHGAFALGLAEGQSEAEAVVFANATAALKCMQPGGREGCPDRAAVEGFLARHAQTGAR
ncbi:PfkB family carbohydrate kinase [Sinisalibacter lacisalsi]|uniref:Ribokinase n=1 Tax=Sinisalibacter lacisalsi TaxID=1526570 RepID=A0ABQ1QLP7_9RHOB|nr:PfkB family carbohydrate kinase [Sinisalibacter lacisalsi]GGD31010.1 ribokinase [Sinisalibacter lacisalsi]